MAIQWFPGHMHLTRKAIGERIKEIDVVIELLDARLPGSSANPLLADLTRGKPALKVLNKQDLADPELFRIVERWRDEAALGAHFATPHMAAFQQAMAQASSLSAR